MAVIENHRDDEVSERPTPCTGKHQWTDWEVIGYTGDWFHPRIVERKCKKCGVKEQDEH